MTRTITLFLMATLVLAGCAHTPQPAGYAFLYNGVTAHRGYSSKYPENTRLAFERAIEAGVDWIETDIHRTGDGVIVLTHDNSTGRFCSVDWKLSERTIDELRTLDFAENFRKERGLSVEDVPAQRIMTLQEAVSFIKQQDRTRIHFELKERIGKQAAQEIAEFGGTPWCGFNCDHLEWLAEAKRVNPGVTLFWDCGPVREGKFADHVADAKREGVYSMVLPSEVVRPETIAMIHAAGMESGAWTINDEPRMKQFLGWGLQRMYTDYPHRLFALKQSVRSE